MGRSIALLLAVGIGLLWGLGWPQVTQASVHTYHESPGQVTYRSRQSFRDNTDRAWQAIAFKRVQGDVVQGVYLRLVGFPGAVGLKPQQPVTLQSATGHQWTLPTALDPKTKELPDSVGQYDLQPLLTDLKAPLPLRMEIPLQDGEASDVAIAPFIVEEWLAIAGANATSSPVGASPGKQADD